MQKSVHPRSASPGWAILPEAAFAEAAIGRKLIALQQSGSLSHRAIAEYILRNPVRVGAWGIEDCAAASRVSPATLSRFARQMGMKNYPELRSAVADALHTILQPVEKLRSTFAGKGGRRAPLADALERTLANVRATADALGDGALERIATRLAAAPTIYVMGFGLSSHLAALLALHLQPFSRHLVNVVEFGGTEVAAGKLMNVAPADVLIVVSFPRYASDAIHLTRYARDRGAHVIALTDSPASPLAHLAHEHLITPARHPVFASSNVAALLVIEALATTLMLSSRENVQQAVKLTDAISSYLYREPSDVPPLRDRDDPA